MFQSITAPQWALFISIAALIVSLATLYFTALKTANLKFHIHEKIEAFGLGNKRGLLTGLTINNTGVWTGVITSISIELVKREKKSPKIIFGWEYFYQEKNISPTPNHIQIHTEFTSAPHPITIPGKVAHTKMIRFLSTQPCILPAGNYNCTLTITRDRWIFQEKKIRRELVITQENSTVLNETTPPGQTTKTIAIFWNNEN